MSENHFTFSVFVNSKINKENTAKSAMDRQRLRAAVIG